MVETLSGPAQQTTAIGPKSLPVFISPADEAKTLAAYDRVLQQWSAPYTERDVPTSFGLTHVIVSGATDAPPVVFLHALYATAAVWYPNAGPLSQRYHTFAVDIIGEPNKSRPTRHPSTLDDFSQWFVELLDGLGIERTYLVGDWLRNGLPLDPAWSELFYLTLLYGSGANPVFPRVYGPLDLARVNTPTLLLIGDRERIYRPMDAVRVAERSMPNLRWAIVPHAHHITALAQPTIVNDSIERFFSEDTAASPPSARRHLRP